MSNEHPDYYDADLVLRVYELRREAVLRESRSRLMREFWPKSWDDVAAVMKPESPLNVCYRQVSTFWEMVYGMVKHGIVHPDYFLESNAEGFFLYGKVEPYLAQIRGAGSPTSFQNAEWVATQSPAGQRVYASIRKRLEKMAASR